MTESIEFSSFDDEEATRIGQDLAATENSHWTELALNIGEDLTVDGARAIARGLKQSKIEQLHINRCVVFGRFEAVLDANVLQPLLEVAIQHCQELELNFPLEDDVAEKLGSLLLLLDDNGANHALQTLDLTIQFSNMTVDGAQQLANGLRHAKLKCLKILAGRSIALNNVMLTLCLAVMDTVEKLDCFCLRDESAIALGNALVGNTTLQTFEFVFDDDVSIDATVTLANGISRSHITHLDMCGDISADAVNILYEAVARSPTIQHLSIGSKFCYTPGLTQCLSRLRALTMGSSVIVEDVPALMTGLRNSPHLSSLALGRTLDDAQDVLTVCTALPHLTSLTELTLRIRLAFDEQQVDNMTMPDLESRRIQAAGAEQLMVAVASHPSLLHLTLDCSYDIGFAGLAMIGMHLPNIKLKALNFECFEDDYHFSIECKCVQQALQRACQAMVAGVKSNWRLQVLTFYEDFFPPKVEDEINFYLDLNKSGRYLLLHDNRDSEDKVPTGLWCHVLSKCGRHNKADFMYYHLREQPTLLLAAGMGRNKLHGELGGPRVLLSGTKRRRVEQAD